MRTNGAPLWALVQAADAKRTRTSSNAAETGGASTYEFPRDDLRYIDELGQGEFGQVVLMEASGGPLGRLKEQSLVAVKTLKDNADTETTKAFSKEMELMIEKNFKHPNVVCLIGVCSTDEPQMIVLEYMDIGDLRTYLNKTETRGQQISASVMISICRQVAAGAAYLASCDVVHRDLAARNVLVGTGPVCKISDFGLGRALNENDYYAANTGGMLPLRWMAPEAVLYARFTVQSDVWSFGVVIWEVMNNGGTPYSTLNNAEVRPAPVVLVAVSV